MKRYPTRALKSLIMFFAMIIIVFALAYGLTPSIKQNMGFWDFVQKNDWKSMVAVLALFSLIYPFVGFISRKICTNQPLSAADKQMIVELFNSAHYVLEKDENKVLVFRHKSTYVRFMRLLFEDTICVDYADSPLVLEGLRRDAYRLSRSVEYRLRQSSEQQTTSEGE